MFAPLQKTPEPAKPAYTPTLRPAQPFFPPRRAVAARPPAQVAPQPGAGLLAAVPTALAPAVAALGHVARQQATYQLLCYALGQDPLTGRAVAATPQALARPLLSLLPDGEARYQQLQAAGPALAQLPAWFETQLAAHHLGRDRLHQLLAHTLAQARNLKWDDILFKLPDVAQALAEPWLRLSLDIGRLLVDSELAMLRLVVRAVLGAEAEPLLALLNQAGGLLLRILRNPLPFVRTLLAASRQGFQAFVAKAPAYLQDAAQHWLFGSLATEGLPVPKTWTPRALLELLLAVLGLSKAHVLARLQTQLRAQVGPAAAGRIQQLGGAALTLWQQGPAGLWHELTTHTGALLPQALGAVQGRLTQLLATGVARLLVKLALPGGALVQVLQSGYDAYETLVARARELAQVGRTLFALAGSLAQGAVAPAAQALEAVLARLLPVALDFLARTFGLDQLPRLLRLGLEALRRPIDKGLDWVLGHIVRLAKNAGKGGKQGGAAAAQAGRQAVGAVKGFFGVRTAFDAGPEHHSLYFAQRNGSTVLIMESTPTEIGEFLDHLELHYPKAAAKTAEIAAIRAHLHTYTPIYQQLADPGLAAARQQVHHRQLLRKNVMLSEMLKKVLNEREYSATVNGKSKSLTSDENRYKLEGMTGKFASQLDVTGDDFTFDHQPQYKSLENASKLRVASGSSRLLFDPAAGFKALAERADGRNPSYAINLSAIRHEAGRTYGLLKASIASAAKARMDAVVARNIDEQQKRDEVVEILKDELRTDVKAMEAVVSPANLDNPLIWGDIDGGWQPKVPRGRPASAKLEKDFQDKAVSEDERTALKKRIAARIRQGEQELLNQPMDVLKTK